MNDYGKLIKSKMISFNEALLSNYKKLNLDETETILLMILNRRIEQGKTNLSVKGLAKRMTLSEKMLSEKVLLLVQRGFIELYLDDLKGDERYSLDPLVEKIGNCFENQAPSADTNKETVQQLIIFIESAYQKPLSPSDYQIVDGWVKEGHSIKNVQEAILESLKAKKTQLRYADAILINKHKQNMAPAQVNPEIKNILEQVYVKKR